MTAHSWETRQMERAQVAAAATVHRLELALIEMESELDFRRVELGQIIAARHARGAQALAAYAAGARVRFGGSDAANEAEPSWDGAPHGAVRTLQESINDAPRLAAEETAALGAVSDLERRVLQTQRLVAHWRAEAGSGSPPPPAPPSDRGPVACAPTVPPPEPEAAKAEAAATQWTAPEPSAAQSPAAGSGSLTIRARLAEMGHRVAGW